MQRPEVTLRLRAGSCRDFALLMMEAARSLGIAARFVSGYIFVPQTRPTAAVGGGARTPGCRSISRAPAGSISIPPTALSGNRNLIRVAVAWDHGQAVPLGAASSGPPRRSSAWMSK